MDVIPEDVPMFDIFLHIFAKYFHVHLELLIHTLP